MFLKQCRLLFDAVFTATLCFALYSPFEEVRNLGHVEDSLLQLEDGQALVLVHVEQEPHLTERQYYQGVRK